MTSDIPSDAEDGSEDSTPSPTLAPQSGDDPVYSYGLKVPKDRVAVIIGKKGSVKSELERQTKSKIFVDSEEGDIFIEGKDPLSLYAAREVIRSISRGFNPEIALSLLKPDFSFEVLNIADFGKTKNDIIRLRGRVIGEEGKSRKVIEELTECSISVYGKTVSIIGLVEDVPSARRAVEALLSGSPHSNVYHFLEREHVRKKRHRMLGFVDDEPQDI